MAVVDINLKVDLDKLTELITEDKEVKLKNEKKVEEVMDKLLTNKAECQAALVQIQTNIDAITDRIVENGVKQSKNFSGIQVPAGIRFGNQAQGAIYKLDLKQLSKIPHTCYKKTLKYAPDTDGIEGYIKKHNKLPAGVTGADRGSKPALSLSGAMKVKVDDIRKST